MTTKIHNDITGVVLIGGQSRRMGIDKSTIKYHDKPQYQYLYELLSHFCSQVYLSCNTNQAKSLEGNYPLIIDRIEKKGPLEAIKSVFNQVNSSILLLPCDNPNITHEQIQELLASRSEEYSAICYSDVEGVINPLYGIWEASCISKLKAHAGDSPKKFLETVKTKALIAEHNKMTNINTQEDLRLFKDQG